MPQRQPSTSRPLATHSSRALHDPTRCTRDGTLTPGSATDIDRLGNEIAELSAHIQAATYRLLVLIAEFDARAGWNSGFRSCAHWLNWRIGLDLGAAREKVRVARTLVDLPAISRAMQRGELSYSKVRALTRIATPENEAELLELALSGTAAHVERLVRAWRRVDRYEALESDHGPHLHRYLRLDKGDDGSVALRARLAPEVGALLEKALDAAMEALYQRSHKKQEPTWTELPLGKRYADALELVAESALAGELDPGTVGDRYQVVLHVHPEERSVARPTTRDEHACTQGGTNLAPSRPPGPSASPATAALRSAPSDLGLGELDPGTHVSAETSRRISCEAGRVVMRQTEDGTMLDVGRKTRTIHPSLRRALRYRDRGCRFPGCTVQHCDAHHVEHWADGGQTRLDNLILLCRFHHRALHEGGFGVELDAEGQARFFRPSGARIPEAPAMPAFEGDPVARLEARHRELGLDIDGDTGLPRWHGERFDLNYTIEALRAMFPF